MADTSIMSIKKFLGLNENQDGDTKIKDGEMSVMRNFRITRENHLQIRPGTQTKMDLHTLWATYYEQHTDKTAVEAPILCGVWHGMVGGVARTLAAYGGLIFDINESEWSAAVVGECSQDRTSFFGFAGRVFMLNGHEYMDWSGVGTFTTVVGYIPVVKTACTPEGNGTTLESVNRLHGFRRVKFSPDGTATVFRLSEQNIDGVIAVEGTETSYTVDTGAGTITFSTPVTRGVNSVTVTYKKGDGAREEVTQMHYAEIYGGVSDSRVFLYGDGSNRTIYSGLDYDGMARGDYFPDLCQANIGESNTPITALVRHYGRLLAFKPGSAYSIYYDTTTLATGAVTPAFYVSAVNRQFGNSASGQVQLVENDPLTLDHKSIYQWRATTKSGNITDNEKNCERISDRVNETIASFDLPRTKTYNRHTEKEYWFMDGGRAVILNYANSTWYIYDGLLFDELLETHSHTLGFTEGGKVKDFSRVYRNDDGAPINAYAATGAMDFGRDWQLKYSPYLWVAMEPEDGARVDVTVESNKRSDYPEKTVAIAFVTYTNADFAHWCFSTNRKPQTRRVKIKVKKATYYKMVFSSLSASATATVLQTDIQLRFAGNVK